MTALALLGAICLGTVALRQVSRNDAAIPRLGEETLLSLDPEHAIVVAA